MLFVHIPTELTIATHTTHYFRNCIILPPVGKYANDCTYVRNKLALIQTMMRMFKIEIVPTCCDIWHLNGVDSSLRNRNRDPGIDEGSVFE
jgi:hypothetical protein